MQRNCILLLYEYISLDKTVIFWSISLVGQNLSIHISWLRTYADSQHTLNQLQINSMQPNFIIHKICYLKTNCRVFLQFSVIFFGTKSPYHCISATNFRLDSVILGCLNEHMGRSFIKLLSIIISLTENLSAFICAHDSFEFLSHVNEYQLEAYI